MSASDSSGARPGAGPQPGQPDPAEIFNTINAHQRSAALRGAIELELFTAIAEGANTTEAIAARCDASERGVRILSDYLTVIGLLTKQDGHYGLPVNSAVFLDKNSPAYMGSAVGFMNSPDLLHAFENVADLVRRGTTLLGPGGTVESEYDGWVEFARSMAPLMAPASEFIGEPGGHGRTRATAHSRYRRRPRPVRHLDRSPQPGRADRCSRLGESIGGGARKCRGGRGHRSL